MILVQTVAITLPLGLTEQFQCHQLVLQQRFLIAGLSSGTLAIFRRRIDSTTLQELVDSKPRMLEGHTGALSCLLIGRAEGLGSAGYLLFSASADRTVRVWDPAVRDLSKACVQTHGGTVTRQLPSATTYSSPRRPTAPSSSGKPTRAVSSCCTRGLHRSRR